MWRQVKEKKKGFWKYYVTAQQDNEMEERQKKQDNISLTLTVLTVSISAWYLGLIVLKTSMLAHWL